MNISLVASKKTKLEKAMELADTYFEWENTAQAHDANTKADQWKLRDQSNRYDYISIRNRLDTIRNLRHAKDDAGLLFTLNEGIHGNMGGMGNHSLYQIAKFGTKRLVTEYVEEIANALRY